MVVYYALRLVYGNSVWLTVRKRTMVFLSFGIASQQIHLAVCYVLAHVGSSMSIAGHFVQSERSETLT